MPSPPVEVSVEKLRYEHSPPTSKSTRRKHSAARTAGRKVDLDWESSLRNSMPLDIRLGGRNFPCR
jgi:hypothetical protein